MSHALDDAAAAALWRLANEQVEHIGLLYEQNGSIRATPTQTTEKKDRTGGRFSLPQGGLRGIFHNHPPRRPDNIKGVPVETRRDRERRRFSLTDIQQAKQLGVPSYIAVGSALRRYDPATRETTDVLAEIPIDEIREHLMRTLFDRAPDDPRGLKR